MGDDTKMTVRIEMPQLSVEGAAVSEGAALASWLVEVGDHVEAGAVVAELETDKSTVELESPASGTFIEILVAAGSEDIQPGTLLALLEVDAAGEPDAGKPGDRAVDLPANPTVSRPAATRGESDPRASTPLARRAAADRGLDLNALEGSGRGGRIVVADVLRSAADHGIAEPEASDSIEEATGSRPSRPSVMDRTLVQGDLESAQRVTHSYLSVRCELDAIVAMCMRLNGERADGGDGSEVSIDDFVIRATALALRDVPAANVHFLEDAVHVFDRVDIAVTVATDAGPMMAVMRAADRKGLMVLAEEAKELARRARAGSLRPEDDQDGTFAISNLGMYDIETVLPILSPPRACILGVGAMREEPVVRGDEIGIGQVVRITLAADPRAVDDRVGAELLSSIRSRLEDPLAMML